jgi:small subunit ribosomal protein S6
LRDYELMVVLAPQTADEELAGALEQVNGYITGAGGEVTEVLRDNPWGRRRLAYPIRKDGQDLRDGYYALYHFRGNAARIGDLERNLKLNDRVLRHMVVKIGEEE